MYIKLNKCPLSKGRKLREVSRVISGSIASWGGVWDKRGEYAFEGGFPRGPWSNSQSKTTSCAPLLYLCAVSGNFTRPFRRTPLYRLSEKGREALGAGKDQR